MCGGGEAQHHPRGPASPLAAETPWTRSLRCRKRRATCQGRAEGTWGTASEGARCELSRDTVVRVTGKEKEQEKVLPWERRNSLKPGDCEGHTEQAAGELGLWAESGLFWQTKLCGHSPVCWTASLAGCLLPCYSTGTLDGRDKDGDHWAHDRKLL